MKREEWKEAGKAWEEGVWESRTKRNMIVTMIASGAMLVFVGACLFYLFVLRRFMG